MAIGTTLKVGFDAAAVRKGFSGLGGIFSGAMRGFRQIGIGAARDVGARMTDTLGRVLMAIPSGIKDTTEWAGDLDDMSVQTGVSVERLVLLEEALKLAGVGMRDTSRTISVLKDNLEEARNGMGPAREALNKLGFLAEDFADIPIDKAFEMIGKKASALPDDFRGLEGALSDLFGAKVGLQMIRFFRNFDQQTRQASKNVGGFAVTMGKSAQRLADMDDRLDRWKQRWRELMFVAADALDATAGVDGSDALADKVMGFMSPERVRQSMVFLRESLAGVFSDDGLSEMLRSTGRLMGEGIAESFKESFSGRSILKGMFGGGSPTASTGGGSFDKLVSQGMEQTGLLRQIAMKKTGGWA
jgi:hypothetical protein